MKHFALAIFLASFSSLASSEVGVVPKFIYVVHGGVDAVWGQYMFMAKNSGSSAEEAEFTVSLPEEAIDWQAQEGLAGVQFNLGKEGGLSFRKSFTPGDNVHTVGFKLPAEEGKGTLTLTMPMDIAELSFMSSGSLLLSAEDLHISDRTEGERFKKHHLYDLKKGDRITLTITGVHEGRSRFWFLAWVTAAVLLIACGGLAYYARPRTS